MGEHALRSTGRPEPVLALDALKAVVAMAVGYGWVHLDAIEIELALTGAGALLTLALTLLTRRKVTPSSDPLARDGSMLVSPSEVLRGDPPHGHGWPFH